MLTIWPLHVVPHATVTPYILWPGRLGRMHGEAPFCSFVLFLANEGLTDWIKEGIMYITIR